MFKRILTLITFLFLGAHLACAGMSSTDKALMTGYAPWTYQFENNTGFGNVIYGYIGITGNGSVNAVTNNAVPVTLQTLKFTANGAGMGGGLIGETLPNGVEGQRLNVNLATSNNSGQLIITPTTSTAFSKITLAAAGQGCELIYQDSTSGWTIGGCYAASSSTYPVVSQ
jgi:hypothetical protein